MDQIDKSGKPADPMPSRQVIFVGGSSYSGSTMMDMILAHGEGGFSCGEVSAAFSPYRRKHLHYEGHVAPDADVSWTELIGAGPDNFYQAIFEARPEITRIVDSSKDPIWIRKRAEALRLQGIPVQHVLIWKTPAEFFASREKRGRKVGWRRAWINYHLMYFSMVKDCWASISYRTLATNPKALGALCNYLKIPYFPEKQNYWQGSFQTLFGNASAKVHLADQDSNTYAEAEKDLTDASREETKNHYRTIYYEPPPSRYLTLNRKGRLREILEVLEATEQCLLNPIRSEPCEIPIHLRCSEPHILARQAKRRLVLLWLTTLERLR